MFKFYHKRPISNQERFQNAIVFGVLASILCLLITFILISFFNVYMSAIYLLYGFIIGYAISYFSHGTRKQFSILATALTIAVIILSDLFTFGSISRILSYFSGISESFSIFWQVGYRIFACIFAYRYSRNI